MGTGRNVVKSSARERRTSPWLAAAALGLLTLGQPAAADISGFVLEFDSGDPGIPIEGARVHLQADTSTVVFSGPDGSFTVSASGAGPFVVTAAVPYDRGAATNYTTAGTSVPSADATDVEIRLQILPLMDDPTYEPFVPEVTVCGSCHPDQVAQWQDSNHSFAGVDTWVLDLFSGTGTPGGGEGYVFRDLHDPEDTGFCATCHTPMADVFDPGNVFLDEVTVKGALQGVTCVACHQMDSVNGDPNGLHHLGTSTYRFPDGDLPTAFYVWGPLDDVSFAGMGASFGTHTLESRFCSSCHQYNNPETGAPGQNTYGEWLDSPFSEPGPDFRSCQDCHMPMEEEEGTVCSVGGPPIRDPEQRHQHDFVGSTPVTLAEAIDLVTTTSQSEGLLTVTAEVTNRAAGHAFPTGVSIRNALLVITANVGGQELIQVAGPQLPFWASDDEPGQQEGDFEGFPGKGFAKVLEGRINGEGPVVRPVLFIDAENVFSDTLIPSGATDVTEVQFELPAGSEGQLAEVSARLLYRRAYRALAVTKGWTETPQGGPVEIEVAANQLQVVVEAGVVEIPALGSVGLLALASLLALAGFRGLRKDRG